MAALKREADLRPVIVVAAIVGVVGAIAIALGVAIEPTRAFAAYLAIWSAAVTLAIGGLAVLLIAYATGAKWMAPIRRIAEAIAGALPALAVLAVPLALGAADVWPWVTDRSSHDVEVKSAWLSLPFFLIRSAIYLAICIFAAERLRRWSRDRDRWPGADVPLDSERGFASAMALAVGLAVTFASFDWLMSLEPGWWSSGFGLYVLTGSLSGGLALVTTIAWRAVARRAMPLTPAHFHALGRLLHAFVILWTYIAFFQAMLIQIANRPDEVTFYLDRQSDGWRVVTWLVVALGFGVPFPLLLFRWWKRRPALLGPLAAIVVAGHVLDMWWLVVPRVAASPVPSWTDLAALAAIGGLATAFAAWRMRGVPLLPVGDPTLADGLRYETTT